MGGIEIFDDHPPYYIRGVFKFGDLEAGKRRLAAMVPKGSVATYSSCLVDCDDPTLVSVVVNYERS